MVIFDCNGVLVDGERIASSVLAEAFASVGVSISAEDVTRQFHGRRASDVFSAVKTATGKQLPPGFSSHVAQETLRRFRGELRPIPHAARALTWVRGPKAVCSSSSFDRIRTSLEITGLLKLFFQSAVLSAFSLAFPGESPRGLPSNRRAPSGRSRPAASWSKIWRRHYAAKAAGMTPIGIVGGGDKPGGWLATSTAGARAVIADMRALHGTIVDLRGS